MHSDIEENERRSGLAGATRPATLLQCHEVIDALTSEVAQLRQRLALLQERLKLDSRNSSKPPSSDGPAGGNRAQRRASVRKRGAQDRKSVV